MTLTSQFIETCLNVLPQRLENDAVTAARQCMTDSLAVAYAAYGEQAIAMLRAVSTEGGRTGESSVIGYGDRGRAADAALVNGETTMIPMQPVTGPAVWTASEIASRDDWNLRLSRAALEELDALLITAKRGTIDEAMASVRERLLNGPGFVLAKGFPVHIFSREDLEVLSR